MSVKKCRVYVTTTYGSPASNIKVTTDVSGSIACVGGRSFYTDSSGYATIEWSDNCLLKRLYVDGKSYPDDYQAGGLYPFTV